MTGRRAACKFSNALSGDDTGEIWRQLGVLAKAIANRAAQELISGRGLNSAAARGEPNLTGKATHQHYFRAKLNTMLEPSFRLI
jgi:hypothetical protein